MKHLILATVLLFVSAFIYTRSINKPAPQIAVSGGPYKTAIFAGGCFWSLESYFEKIPSGVVDVVSGYSGGETQNPTYQSYADDNHKEVVQVTYDPAVTSYKALVDYFFRHIDPTDEGGSFYDRGPNYTSTIYYENDEEKTVAKDIIVEIDRGKVFEKPIVTTILPRSKFWPAEKYHQDYAKKNPAQYAAYRMGSGRDAFLKRTWEGQ